jgi:hypothetical protein
MALRLVRALKGPGAAATKLALAWSVSVYLRPGPSMSACVCLCVGNGRVWAHRAAVAPDAADFPGRHAVVAEWLVGSLLRSATAAPEDRLAGNVGAWELLALLLVGTGDAASAGEAEADALGAALRAPLVPAWTTVVADPAAPGLLIAAAHRCYLLARDRHAALARLGPDALTPLAAALLVAATSTTTQAAAASAFGQDVLLDWLRRQQAHPVPRRAFTLLCTGLLGTEFMRVPT